MENGTAIGLLVGGAVLLLAVAPRRPGTYQASGQPTPAPGGLFNPWNLIQGGGANPFAQQQQFPQPSFPIPAPGSTPAFAQNPGYQNIGYTPSPGQGGTPNGAWTPGGYGSGNYSGGNGTAANYGGTPNGGFMNTAYMSPAQNGSRSAYNTGSPAQSYAA